jgi:hypothetical protein
VACLLQALPLGSSLVPLSAAATPSTTTTPRQVLGAALAAGVLCCGLVLALAPGLLFGGLLSGSGAETIAACVLEVAIYGYLLLQVWV